MAFVQQKGTRLCVLRATKQSRLPQTVQKSQAGQKALFGKQLFTRHE